MAAYDYYRSSNPGWGTNQFQFGPPPMPTFQPQPSWTGMDFFNAHAVNPDPTLYSSIMGGLNSLTAMGVDHRTARQRHRMVYGGLTPMSQLLPADIGAAAAYEAYRTWKYNSSLYAPLSADRMMQREGLIATAMAEATRLWQYTGRVTDVYGQRAACESAAATATILADRFLSYAGMAGGAGLVPSPMGSPYGGAGTLAPGGYGTYGVPYAGSYGSYSPSGGQQIAAPAGATVVVSGHSHSHRSHSRGRSHSRDRDHHHHHHGSHSHSSRRSSSHSHHHLLPLPSHHSDHHHHHHHSPHRRRSVEIIQPAGGTGYGYAPYYGSAGYSGYGNAYGGGYGYGRYGYPYSSSYHDSGCVIS